MIDHTIHVYEQSLQKYKMVQMSDSTIRLHEQSTFLQSMNMFYR